MGKTLRDRKDRRGGPPAFGPPARPFRGLGSPSGLVGGSGPAAPRVLRASLRFGVRAALSPVSVCVAGSGPPSSVGDTARVLLAAASCAVGLFSGARPSRSAPRPRGLASLEGGENSERRPAGAGPAPPLGSGFLAPSLGGRSPSSYLRPGVLVRPRLRSARLRSGSPLAVGSARGPWPLGGTRSAQAGNLRRSAWKPERGREGQV